MDLKSLIQKYSVAGPRYTSYPTAPQLSESIGIEQYRKHLGSEALASEKEWGLYIHIPFCESRCHYCGCNTQATKDRSINKKYVQGLLKELQSVAGLMGGRKILTQISWGGGTPTFLAVDEIRDLHQGTKALFEISSDADLSLEIDPRVTSTEQLECLRNLGFNRVSLGIQDFNVEVQRAINRNQSLEQTKQLLEVCRSLQFNTINFDLIYGLPFQTLASFEQTIDKVIEMRPSRIALFNYARLPKLLKHQNILEAYPMPSLEERVGIFTNAYEKLLKAGYGSIGMDHFALESDELYQAVFNGQLYRSFQGYVVKKSHHLIGLGASAIGELGDTYFQNVRQADDYMKSVYAEGLATLRGFFLSPEDKLRKWVIQRIMCQFELLYGEFHEVFGYKFEKYFNNEQEELRQFCEEGLLEIHPDRIKVTSLGRLLVRNVAMVFDAYLKKSQGGVYSKTV